MFMNVILLDVFNTLGLPTSTTVSLVFGLLGAAVSVSVFKIANSDLHTIADLASYINTGKAMAIISGILLSVAIAFVCGTVVMYVTRLIFSYRYQRKIKSVGAIWCGIAVTAISLFCNLQGPERFIVDGSGSNGLDGYPYFDTAAHTVRRLEYCHGNFSHVQDQYLEDYGIGRYTLFGIGFLQVMTW